VTVRDELAARRMLRARPPTTFLIVTAENSPFDAVGLNLIVRHVLMGRLAVRIARNTRRFVFAPVTALLTSR
jgi:hypothetical protein